MQQEDTLLKACDTSTWRKSLEQREADDAAGQRADAAVAFVGELSNSQLIGIFLRQADDLFNPFSATIRRQCLSIIYLMRHLAIIPVSSANVERDFSYLKIIKSANRNRLQSKHLADLLMIKLDGPPVDSFDFNALLQKFGRTPRRLSFAWLKSMIMGSPAPSSR